VTNDREAVAALYLAVFYFGIEDIPSSYLYRIENNKVYVKFWLLVKLPQMSRMENIHINIR